MRSLLAIPTLYRFFAQLIGGVNARTRFVKEHIRPQEGDKILDIGCGPADILEFLLLVNYVGFDASARYIAAAQKRFGPRGRFFCAMVNRYTLQEKNFDLVIASGILHHLNDAEALELF
ncbi:MAG: methyltransferase domain-containing protein [Candidatus Competibacteraceae bacterium]|nr:methyltransferase domain-containing protein [Candidatus Competibacteraceae bacterium]